MLAESTVLVTGGSGSVGRSLVSRLLQRDIDILRILDNNEPGLASLRAEFSEDRCRFFSVDVQNRHRLSRAMVDVDVVLPC